MCLFVLQVFVFCFLPAMISSHFTVWPIHQEHICLWPSDVILWAVLLTCQGQWKSFSKEHEIFCIFFCQSQCEWRRPEDTVSGWQSAHLSAHCTGPSWVLIMQLAASDLGPLTCWQGRFSSDAVWKDLEEDHFKTLPTCGMPESGNWQVEETQMPENLKSSHDITLTGCGLFVQWQLRACIGGNRTQGSRALGLQFWGLNSKLHSWPASPLHVRDWIWVVYYRTKSSPLSSI